MIDLPPALILILGALLIPLFKGRAKSVYVVALPLLGFINLLSLYGPLQELGATTRWTVNFLDFELTFGRIDKLSLLFGNIFSLVTIIAFIYILHTKDDLEYMSGMIYAGSALGVVFAGDLLSLFAFWEMLTLCAVGCMLARRTEDAKGAALRYLLVHVTGGLVLLAGIIMHIHETGTAEFSEIGLSGTASWLIFIGFGLNCAWPLLHAWLPDAYSEAGIGGAVFMATFTTKTAVYVLARTFPGEDILMWIGMSMAVFPIFYAAVENDLRRVLAYGLISQVGFMVVGIGLGTAMSLNGAGAHAFSHILYKSLLFMSIGAVMYRTGKSKATELGGLVRSMPLTCLFCCVGVAAMAFPLFCGFVSKSMIISAVGYGHHTFIWLVLLFAVGAGIHFTGIKTPFFAFFSQDAGIRVKEAPTNMLVAMGIAAFFCVSVSLPFFNLPYVGYQFLYDLLPHTLEKAYEPYTFAHVNGQLLLLLFSALAFVLMLLAGKYPSEIRSVNVDFDVVYRRGAKGFYAVMDRSLNSINSLTKRVFVSGLVGRLERGISRGPIWIVRQGLQIVWELQRLDADTIKAREKAYEEQVELGVFPIGITGVLAIALMAVLFCL